PPEALPTVTEQLAMLWADTIDYPFPDVRLLARVAQYNLITSADAEQAKSRYLRFLKRTLLALAQQNDPQAVDIVAELEEQIGMLTFSEMAAELDYPRFESDDEDSLRLLARLNTLPIYITTSYYDFMERALRAEGRRPRTQICFWRGVPSGVDPQHLPDPDYRPSPEQPVVYHLHGHERYPTSIVLSEDDYTDFLVRVSQPIDTNDPLIPIYLLSAMAESTLLLLGYRLHDWDFRTLFKGIITAQQRIDSLFSLAIQLRPGPQDGVVDVETAENYLEAYFDTSRFKVEWGESYDFISRLWQAWNEVRR
ncbi:MAG: SIR2 family protein, partial [Candidatus Promineifilaceae bacterium]|nr:SIR2 family protein [Candidatus Promineifilaceae bacterium]